MRKAVLMVMLVFLAACATSPVTGKLEFMLMGEQEEIEWGERMFPAVLWGDLGGGGRYVDPELEGYLATIVRDIHKVSHRPGIPMTFVIQDSSVPNAWAIPGHVSMTRGLLANLENEAQFAFVMGHEIGHVAARHSAKQYTRGVLQSAALGGFSLFLEEGQGWLVQAAAIGSTLFFLKYSRDDELQSDRLGVEYMALAGYRPLEAVSAHRQLEKAVQEYARRMGQGTPEDNFLSNLLSTHPRTEVRLDEVRGMAETAKAGPLRGDGLRAEQFNSRLAGLRKVDVAYQHYDRSRALFREEKYDDAGRELDEAFRISDRQAPFFNLRGLIQMRVKKFEEARKSFNRAIEIYPDYQPAWQSLGLMEYERESYEAALPPLRRSLEIFPQSIGSHYLLGMSLYKLERYSQCIPHLEVFRDAAPKDPEVHGLLGIAYEDKGDMAAAYGEYRAQVALAPDTELGRHAARRIAALEPILKAPK